MTLTLDPQLEQRIQRHIDSGPFSDANEVLNAALDALMGQEAWSEEEKADLDRRLDESMAAIERGEGIPGDRAREILAERRATKAKGKRLMHYLVNALDIPE